PGGGERACRCVEMIRRQNDHALVGASGRSAKATGNEVGGNQMVGDRYAREPRSRSGIVLLLLDRLLTCRRILVEGRIGFTFRTVGRSRCRGRGDDLKENGGDGGPYHGPATRKFSVRGRW